MSSTCIQKKPPLHPLQPSCLWPSSLWNELDAEHLDCLLVNSQSTKWRWADRQSRGRFSVMEGSGAVQLVSRKSIQLSSGRSAAFIHAEERRETRIGQSRRLEDLKSSFVGPPSRPQTFYIVRLPASGCHNSTFSCATTSVVATWGTLSYLWEHELRHIDGSRSTFHDNHIRGITQTIKLLEHTIC